MIFETEKGRGGGERQRQRGRGRGSFIEELSVFEGVDDVGHNPVSDKRRGGEPASFTERHMLPPSPPPAPLLPPPPFTQT